MQSPFSPDGAKPAKVLYEAGQFRLLASGLHVVCAVSGRTILLDDLKYWSVTRQEAYASAEIAYAREREAMGNSSGPVE